MSTADPMQQFHFAPMPSSPLAPHPTTPIFSTTMTSNSASMFNFSPTAASNTQSPRQTSRYQPTSPSRLSPQRSPGTTTTTTPTRTPESTNTNANTYAQRYATIAKPLQNAPPRTYTASASPSARTARRNLFLNRIKQDRDTGRFETRGEQLVLMEHAAEQKMWWEAMRRRADGLLSAELGVLDEEEMGNDPSGLFSVWV
ncbi:hypothetical protein BDV59DRAFT_169558 [Aspergillus ambiguus]|uniref:uncharacterized protein n=1 Tax=Aspergillus ambiguus TaxID=176160 RepID=UPI003CCCF3EF